MEGIEREVGGKNEYENEEPKDSHENSKQRQERFLSCRL